MCVCGIVWLGTQNIVVSDVDVFLSIFSVLRFLGIDINIDVTTDVSLMSIIPRAVVGSTYFR